MSKPTQEELDSFAAEALAWCNERRAEQGKEPLGELPKGKIGDPISCPCGKATNLWVCAGSYWEYPISVGSSPKSIPVSAVRRFIQAFDSGSYPELKEA